jgi:hypothetical protein
MTRDYRHVKRANWDERAPAHAASADYALERFRSDPRHLERIGGGEWRLKDRPERLPHTYTLQAVSCR